MRSAQISAHHATRVTLGGSLAALVAAAPEPAATVLLVPGYTGSKEDFAPLLDPLAGAGHTAVAVDLPGQYESPGPPDEDAYRPAVLGPMIAGVVDGLAAGAGAAPGRPVILLGHSFGGLVCRAAVLAGTRVAGLVLLCSGPAALPSGHRESTLHAGEPILRAQGIDALLAVRESVEPPVRPPELAAFLRERFLASTTASLLGMATALRTEPDLVDALATALRSGRIPCLVACGVDDDAWPPALQRDMAARLGAPFATIPGAAHAPNVENPQALLDLLLPAFHAWL